MAKEFQVCGMCVVDEVDTNDVLKKANKALTDMNKLKPHEMSCRQYGVDVWEYYELWKYGIACAHADDMAPLVIKVQKRKNSPDHFALLTFDNEYVTWYFNDDLHGYVYENWKEDE